MQHDAGHLTVVTHTATIVAAVAVVVSLAGVGARADQHAQIEAWRSSPFHGAISGATGAAIPCLCRFRDQSFKLGDRVCMQTPNGMMITRCDLHQNNTTWVPTDEACTLSLGPAPSSSRRKS